MSEIMRKLERARAFELEAGVQLEHIERLHRIAARVKSDGRGGTEYAVSIVEKLSKLERELNRHIDLLADAKRDALEIVSLLEGEERAVIYSYYILAKDWSRTAAALYMSERRVYMLRRSALARLENSVYGERRKGAGNGNRAKNKAAS